MTLAPALRITRTAFATASLVGATFGAATPRHPLRAQSNAESRSTSRLPQPGARVGHALGSMGNAGVLVLFGGFLGDGQPRNDTWVWNGRTWRLVDVPGPPPRRWPAMAYDSRRQRLVLHGGRDGVGARGQPLDDTWEWDGARWRQIATSGPGGRDHHRLVYDARRDRIVLFGGWDGTRTRDDTWELDGAGWRQVATTGPSARAAHGMAYDALRGEVLLFGGSADTTFFGDAWRWNGREWNAITSPGPPARSFHGMTYDAGAGVIVVAGGRRGASLYGDTWTFDGTRWQERADTTLPARYVYDLAYDAPRGEVLFHGGGFMRHGRWALFDETWTRRSARWNRVLPATDNEAAVASERCYRFDRPTFHWVGDEPGGGRARADSSAVMAFVDAIHRAAPETLLDDESPPQTLRVPGVAAGLAPARWLNQSHWRLLAPDSVEVVWRNGRYGAVLQLAQTADTLRGRVEFTTDLRGATPHSRTVTAVRVDCASDVR